MNRHHTKARAALFALASIPFAVAQALAAQTTATWIGPAGGAYGTASNRDIGQVPINNATTTYSVLIGSGKSVGYSLTNSRQIDELLLDLGTSFSLFSSSLVLPTDLAVLGRALIGGAINADRATFTARGAGTDFVGNTVSVSATNGGVVTIGAQTFDVGGYTGRNVLNAAGNGSRIDLSTVQAFESRSPNPNFTYTNTVTASDRAVIDLSGVRKIVAPATTAGALSFSATGGALIRLSSLQDVAGATLNTGSTSFSADGGSFVLGPLRSANRMFVSLQNASTMSLGGFAGSASITDSTFAVSGNSRLNAATLVGELNTRGFNNATVLSATGNGSLIDLSGLQTINSGAPNPNFSFTTSIAASDKAVINLSGVKTIVAPATGAGTLAFSAISGASINLLSLQDVAGLTLDSGNTSFTADAGSFALGPLKTLNRVSVSLSNGSTMTAGASAGGATITNSTFGVSSGSRLNAATLIGTYGVRAFNNATVLSATGVGSLLDLSGLQSINSGAPNPNFNFTTSVAAADQAVIDLSGVKSLVAPASGAGTLAFTAISGASIKLGALQDVAGLTLDTGNTRFAADGGNITVGPLRAADRMSVTLQNGATMSMGGFAGSASITNSTFAVSGGSRLNAAPLVGELSVRAFNNAIVLSASGAGSVLDLSGLHTLNSSAPNPNFNFTTTVTATDKALLDLSGLRTVVAPATGAGTLAFTATTGANLKLTSLLSVDTTGGGQVAFNASSAGSLAIRGINAGPSVRFNLSDAGSSLNVTGNLALLNGSTMAAGAGTRIDIDGSFSFAQVVESQMNLDAATLAFSGGGVQSLEVGGRRLATLTAGAPVTGNFGIGQLSVGQSGTAMALSLVDAIDNGNRATREALYLNGVGTGGNGLRILGGSVLALDRLDLYTFDNGSWVHINDLFAPGQTLIAYDQGFISLLAVPEPGSLLMLAAGLGVLAIRRRSAERNADTD